MLAQLQLKTVNYLSKRAHSAKSFALKTFMRPFSTGTCSARSRTNKQPCLSTPQTSLLAGIWTQIIRSIACPPNLLWLLEMEWCSVMLFQDGWMPCLNSLSYYNSRFAVQLEPVKTSRVGMLLLRSKQAANHSSEELDKLLILPLQVSNQNAFMWSTICECHHWKGTHHVHIHKPAWCGTYWLMFQDYLNAATHKWSTET